MANVCSLKPWEAIGTIVTLESTAFAAISVHVLIAGCPALVLLEVDTEMPHTQAEAPVLQHGEPLE